MPGNDSLHDEHAWAGSGKLVRRVGLLEKIAHPAALRFGLANPMVCEVNAHTPAVVGGLVPETQMHVAAVGRVFAGVRQNVGYCLLRFSAVCPEQLRQKWVAQGITHLRHICLGINNGQASVGALGS